MNMTFGTYYEQLCYEVNSLKRFSREADFTAYLDTVVQRANQAPDKSLELRNELIRNYLVYSGRQSAAGVAMPATYMECIYPNMDVPTVIEAAKKAAYAQPQQAAQPVQQPQQAAQPQQTAQPVQQPQKTAKTKVKKPGAEYAVGGIVLSILGTALILTGFIMLAVNFFDSFWQGMCLYLVCAALLAVSEFVIKRFVKKLSYVFSGLGIAGFFVVTLVNYFSLHLFGFWVTMGILLALSVLAAVFARYKKAVLFTIIGYVSVFTQLSLIANMDSITKLYVLYGVMFCELILWILIPADKNGVWFSYVTAAGSILFLISVVGWNDFIRGDVEEQGLIVRSSFVTVNFLVLMLGVLVSGIRFFCYKTDENGNKIKRNPAGIIASLEFGAVYHAAFNMIYLDSIDIDIHKTIVICASAVLTLAMAVLSIRLLYKKENVLWQAVAVAAAVYGIGVTTCFTPVIATVLGIFVYAVGIAALARITKKRFFKIFDLIIKIYFSIICITAGAVHGESYNIGVIAAAVCLVALIAIGSGYLVPSHIILTGTFIFVVCSLAPNTLYLMLISGALAVAVFVFHNVKWLKAKRIVIFDIFALVALAFVLGFLNHFLYRNDTITTLIVFCFGLAILVQYSLKSYGMFFAGNMMPIAIYLSYFVFVLRLKEAFVTSAILMGVALVCVSLGFLMKQKAVRIYGLVLALLVCIKLVFFDFASAASLVKTIMYFVVGFIALAISGVYIVMEMLMLKKAQNEENKSVQNNDNLQ
ncbi:MAG: YfhO family protein [Lachnospiraceae bacterium]|nr:YfhO family protein [Lachnospiraceae bacterium]